MNRGNRKRTRVRKSRSTGKKAYTRRRNPIGKRSRLRMRRKERSLRVQRIVRPRNRTIAARRRLRKKRPRREPNWISSSAYDWMFYAPSADARMRLSRSVWRRLRQQLPPGYAIPDRSFIRFVRAQAGLAGG